jgi:hypothetical protein
MKTLHLNTLLLMAGLALLTSHSLPAQTFEVGTLTRTYSYTKPTTYGLGYFYVGGDGFSSIYTRGRGATNTAIYFDGWWTTENLVSPNYGHLLYSRHGTNVVEWGWHAENYLTGAWNTDFITDTNRYLISVAPWVIDVVTNYPAHRTFLSMTPSPGDFANSFSGPVGTITTEYENGAVTTDTYTTTAGLYIPGDPTSTNEHFYRVRLSLEYSDRTPISVPQFIASYLGQAPDTQTNIYVWLGEGKEYTAKPVFKTASPPSFYSYHAEVNQAQQLGTLIVSTITRGSSWPGSRPADMALHMGYPATEPEPSDDQMAFDFIMNSPLASKFEPLITAGFLALGYPLASYEIDHSRGVVSSLTEDERKYMVLLLLARSINPDPPETFDYTNLDLFTGTNFVYRLVNEFAIEAAGYSGKFGHKIDGKNIRRKQAKIGKTTLNFEADVKLNLIVTPVTGAAYPLQLSLPAFLLNPVIGLASASLENESGAGHGTLYGGQKGAETVKLFCAGRAGETLRDLEQPLLRRMPPDFSCWAIFDIAGDWVTPRIKLSLEPVCTWPTFFDYSYDFGRKLYLDRAYHPQTENPFDGFLTLGQ